MKPERLIEVYRGELVESFHFGHLAISNNRGEIIAFWGDPKALIFPRSSCKIIQALPLVEMGSAKKFSLENKHLALACASHSGAEKHLNVAKNWLLKIGLNEKDLLCGYHLPYDKVQLNKLKKNKKMLSQLHNNCSGKHLSFLTISKSISQESDNIKNYININHPVQKIVKKTFEEISGYQNSVFALDGCSAPNFACSIQSLAKAMAIFANPEKMEQKRKDSIEILKTSVLCYPDLIAGDDRLCTKIIKKSNNQLIVKVGADGVYTAILLDKGLGIALKICDGSRKAAECLIVTILIRLGYLKSDDPDFINYLNIPIHNCSNKKTGIIKASDVVWKRVIL